MKLTFTSAQARGAVLVNLDVAGTLFVTNYRLVFLVCLMASDYFWYEFYVINPTCMRLILRWEFWRFFVELTYMRRSFLKSGLSGCKIFDSLLFWNACELRIYSRVHLLSGALGCIRLTRRSLWMAQGGGAKLPLPLGTIPLLTIENFSKQVRSHVLETRGTGKCIQVFTD